MSDFKAKMHHNRFRSAPYPAGELTALPPDGHPSWNKEDLLLRKEVGCRERKGRRGMGRQGEGTGGGGS